MRDDATTERPLTKYLDDFPFAVRQFMKPPVGGWTATYSEPAAIEQAIRRAYHAGRMDGLSEAMRLAAPSVPPLEADEDAEWREWAAETTERLDLFTVSHDFVPEPLSAVLSRRETPAPLGAADHLVWSVRAARAALGLSLAESSEFVTEVLSG